MLRDVVFRRWAHTAAIHAASHVDHKKRVSWFSISMHECGSLPIVMVLRYNWNTKLIHNCNQAYNVTKTGTSITYLYRQF